MSCHTCWCVCAGLYSSCCLTAGQNSTGWLQAVSDAAFLGTHAQFHPAHALAVVVVTHYSTDVPIGCAVKHDSEAILVLFIVLTGPARCLQALLTVAAFLAVEVNVFFLKYALWVPPTNPLNTARLVLWLLVGAPAVREYYEFIEVKQLCNFANEALMLSSTTAWHSTVLCCRQGKTGSTARCRSPPLACSTILQGRLSGMHDSGALSKIGQAWNLVSALTACLLEPVSCHVFMLAVGQQW